MSRRQRRRRVSRRRTHMAVASGGLAAVASLGTGGIAHAAQTFTVSNLNDSGAGSLRQAVLHVNADATDVSAPGDSIVFASGLSGTIALTSGELDLTKPAQIIGPGARQLTIRAAASHRILYTPAYIKVSDLTLTGGSVPTTYGGAIFSSAGNVEVDNAIVTGNSAQYGGGVFAFGSITVDGSTITGNAANSNPGSEGGGICDYGGATTVTDSTITGNAGSAGAAISNYGGNELLTGSTIAGNTVASGSSGGQVNLAGSGSQLTLDDTIVSGSGAVPDVVLASGTSGSGAFSLIRDAAAPSGDVAITTDATDITGQDPKLGPLAFNGGPTPTMVPLPTSPVLDQGKSFGLSTDQRGLSRPFALPTISHVTSGGDRSDIGAIEVHTPAIAALSPGSGTNGTRVTITGTGFTGATKVLFRSTPATSFTVVNDTTITAVAPAKNGGSFDVRVVSPLGESTIVTADRFTFQTFKPTVTKHPHAKLHGRTVDTGVTVSCPAGGFACAGSFKATAFIEHHKMTLAHGSLNIRVAGHKKIQFQLSKTQLAALKSAGHLKITLRIVIADGNGQKITFNRTITIKPPKAHK